MYSCSIESNLIGRQQIRNHVKRGCTPRIHSFSTVATDELLNLLSKHPAPTELLATKPKRSAMRGARDAELVGRSDAVASEPMQAELMAAASGLPTVPLFTIDDCLARYETACFEAFELGLVVFQRHAQVGRGSVTVSCVTGSPAAGLTVEGILDLLQAATSSSELGDTIRQLVAI